MYKVKDNKLVFKNGSIKEGIIAVASGKGGVGKSTVTVNLATAIARLDKKVGIIDADVHGFSIPRIIGLKDEAEAVNEKEIIPPEANGVKVISMGSFVGEGSPVIWRGPLLTRALEQFIQDVHWGELDYLLLDLPPGTGDMALNIMQKLPHAETLIITTPQITATNVAGRIGKMAEKMNSDVMGIIENMSYYQCTKCGNKDYIFGQGGGEALAERLNTKLLGKLPLITSVREKGDEGKPIVMVDESSPVSKAFYNIARNIIDREVEFDTSKAPMNFKNAK